MAEIYDRKLPFKDVVFVDSPQFISVAHAGNTTAPAANSFNCEVYAWDGLKASVPATPIATLSQASTAYPDTASWTNVTYATFEISEFIKGLFDLKFIDSGTTAIGGNTNFAWFKLIITADTSVITYDSGVHLATLGWGDFSEGGNPGINTSELDCMVIGLADTFNASTLESKRYPIYVGEDSTFQFLNINNGNDVFASVTVGNTNSDTQFEIIKDSELIGVCGANVLTVSGDVDSPYTVNFKNEKGQNVEVLYYGKEGVQCTLSMLGRVDESERRKVNTYKNSELDLTPLFDTPDTMRVYDTLKPQLKTNSLQSTIRLTVSSGIVSTSEAESYRDLFKSKHIWVDYLGTVYPAVISDTSFKLKNNNYDQIHEYTFVFEIANPLINQVV